MASAQVNVVFLLALAFGALCQAQQSSLRRQSGEALGAAAQDEALAQPQEPLREQEAEGAASSQPSPMGEATIAEVEKSLVAELVGSASHERLQELEAALKPMYDALPKEESGHLGHQAVRYALHRLLLQRHGWFVVGLEPTDKVLPPYLHADWVPQYLQGLLEKRLGDRGLTLHETAALAATLEDLVHAEDSRRLDTVMDLLHLPAETRLIGGEADRVLETYMMMYLDGDNLTAPGKDMDAELALFKQEYTDWENAAAWMQKVKSHHGSTSSDGKIGRTEMVSVAKDLGDHFSNFNDGECRSLKRELTSMEGPRPGRVPLVDFYDKGLYSHWQFNEKVDYLRVLGALDESDPYHPSVIVPNYLGSRPNCLTPSRLYAVCCRNECEDLMGHLERKLASSTASAEEVVALVSELTSDTVNTSRTLSDGLVQRLKGIAERHGGRVPLHGRLFAQWMHHAYPRECPYPHEGGVNPQTPDEWMQEAGEQQQDARASEAEVRKLVDSTRARSGSSLRTKAPATELPWTDAEVLLAQGPLGTEGPESRIVLAKAVLLFALLVCMFLHKNGLFCFGRRSCQRKKRMARNLDFDLDDFEDDLKKPGQRARQLQYWLVLLGLIPACLALEAMGLLDRFSFACFLFLGLLLNVALPLALQRGPFRGLKAKKHID